MLERGTTLVGTAATLLCMTFSPTLASRVAAQTPAGAATAQAPARDANTTMTLTGCLMKESDYRKAHNIGDNPLNRLGEGDEFVLVDTAPATPAPASSSSQPASARRARPSAVSNPCREAGTGPAYRMAGKLEDDLKGFEGHRLQITGKFEHSSDAQVAAGQKPATLPAEIEISAYQDVTAAPAPASAVTARTPTRNATPESVQTRNEPAPAASQTANRGSLPRTASNGPLFAFGGLILLAVAGMLRLARGTAI